jgi:arginyl-tRNA synthetase
MFDPIFDARLSVRALIGAAFGQAFAAGALPEAPIPEYALEIPADRAHGDLAANVALISARTFKMAPRALADVLLRYLSLEGGVFSRAEIAGPGFLNFFFADAWYARAVAGMLREGESFGRSNWGEGRKIMVEFVSANPTGPMHMGNARGGAIGDCLAGVLDWAGFRVTREFLINDAGNQVEKFGASLEARYLQIHLGEEAVVFPEDGYHGDDIRERAAEFSARYGDGYVSADSASRRRALIDYALPANIEKLKSDLSRYRISFDVWFKESSLHEAGAVEAAIRLLSSRGMTYEKDGALWYRATDFGGDKDEVLVRQNSFPTYFAADIAYHYNKFAVRGFERVINIWGADHHGHVARLKGAMDAIGLSGDKLDVIIMQLVRLTRGGEPVRMSKRSGKSVTLGDLLDEVPVDAARFFFNMREPGSSLDFDLDLAVEQSSQNPVYYVQYAHARICSILKNLSSEGVAPRFCTEAELALLTAPEERTLIRLLALLPDEIVQAAKKYDPARLTHYLLAVCAQFHRFYTECRVKSEDEALMQARLSLCLTTQVIICNVLGILKIDAPESM